MTYDTQQLDAELRAQNLRIHGCSSVGRIDWAAPPTGADLATAKGVLAAHDPGKRERDQTAERVEIRDIVLRLMQDTRADVWGQLAPATRQETTRLGLRLAAMIARRMG